MEKVLILLLARFTDFLFTIFQYFFSHFNICIVLKQFSESVYKIYPYFRCELCDRVLKFCVATPMRLLKSFRGALARQHFLSTYEIIKSIYSYFHSFSHFHFDASPILRQPILNDEQFSFKHIE